ncbi:MAG: type II toxin-antitoxin system VapC family toxin [Planctomycetia bacterium]|nr:type II toxin-antitoxin system VapC family toxin [Planctomycetia bacterium]
MKVLLDTHTFLWFVLNSSQLSQNARQVLEDSNTDVFISPASYWEMAIKVRKGNLELLCSYDEFMKKGIVGNDFEILPVSVSHTSQLTTQPEHHRDPFDRLIIAQAIVESLPLVGNDAAFDDYGVNRIW